MLRASSIPIISAVYSDALLEHDSDKVKECGIMLPSGVINTIPTPYVGRTLSSVIEAPSKYISQAFDVGLDATSVQ